VVIPNADLFTHAVIVNTANDIRRWEYEFTMSGPRDLAGVKSCVIDAVRNAPGVLPQPAPEALIAELGDQTAGTFKMRVLWWTKAPRQHEMLVSYDAVLTAIHQALREAGEKQGLRPAAA